MKPILSNDLIKESLLIKMLDTNGEIINPKEFVTIPNELLLKAYKVMNLSRNYEQQAFQWQRQGKMLTFPPAMGQEAIQVAIGMNIRKNQDWFISGYRDNATWLYLERPLKQIFQYWCGNEKGSSLDAKQKLLPVNVLIGTQFSHATGIALANKIRNEDSITITVIGDGGTSSGEFYSAMNFAAKLGVSVIFIIQNNQWAISTPLSSQTNCKTLAQKATAAGIAFFRVDGNDLFASNAVIEEAINYVKKNQAPILIEAVTYRIGPHTTADDPTIYRTHDYHQKELEKCPLIRTKKFLIKQKIWSEKQQKELDIEQAQYINDEFKAALDDNIVSLWDIFKDTYQNNDDQLMEQYKQLKNFFNLKGETTNGDN